MTKNATRIASLMGTWSAQTEMKASVGDYSLVAYFIIHFMPDPMRGYGCEIKGCKEVDNQVCTRHVEGNAGSKKCFGMEGNVVDWSDVSAFFYFGARVDAGFPFGVHVVHDTAGWIGPLSIIMAQNETLGKNETDHYQVRYVESPTTPYLRMEPNCTLFSPGDFEKYMGLTAVRQTIPIQANITHGEDPYSAFLGTCDNGDVEPILPLFDFKFVESGGEEKIQIQLDYKVLTFPHKKDIMYKVYPTLQKRLNRREGEFHVSGPYCYGDDPKRGYTFDFSYDSRHANDFMTLVHGCVEGLPCLPSAGEITPTSGNGATVVYNSTSLPVKTLSVGPVLILSFIVVIMTVSLMISLAFNCCSGRVRELLVTANLTNEPDETEPDITDVGQIDMTEPLLVSNGDENAPEVSNEEEVVETA